MSQAFPYSAPYGSPYGFGAGHPGLAPAERYRAGVHGAAAPYGFAGPFSHRDRYGPYATNPMFPSGPVDAVVAAEQWFAFWNKRSPEMGIFIDPVAMTFKDEIGLKDRLPDGSAQGYDVIKQVRDLYHVAFPDIEFRVENVTQPDADGVFFTKWSASGTNTGPLHDVPASGKAIKTSGVIEFQIIAGRVVSATLFSGRFLPYELDLIPTK